MKVVKVEFKNKPLLEFKSDAEFQDIIKLLCDKYGDYVGFEIKEENINEQRIISGKSR